MKFDQLQYFVEAARRQHIGQAAKILNISASAISHSIASLESDLGQTLFEKQGRQIKLTPHGRLLLDRAEFLLTEVGRIRHELASGELEMRGHYRVGATHVLCSEFLMPTWMDLQKDHSALTATVHSLRSGEVLARVASGELDLGICFSPHSASNYEQELLFRGRLVLSFGKDHPFLRERNLDDLGRHPMIAALSAQGIENCESHPAFNKLRIQPKVINLYDSYDVAISALKTNRVWSLLPDFVAYANRADIETYQPRGWDLDYKIAAVWPKNRVRAPALDVLVEQMREAVHQAAIRRQV